MMLMLFTPLHPFDLSCDLVTYYGYYTFDLENKQGPVLSQDASVCEILWSYVKAFMGKMWQFHLNMNIEGTLWRHAVTSSVTSWTSKTLFM